MEHSGRRCPSAAFLCGRTGLLLLVTGYALLGALVFKTLEGGIERNVPVHIQRSREDCLRELWLITERLNVLYEKNWTRLVTEQLKRFERVVVESGKSEDGVSESKPHWTFGGALLYTLTLLTTVGYGRLSPRTTLGKIIAMLYALVGVPLMLILLSLLGSLMAEGVRKGYAKLCGRGEASKIAHSIVGYHKAPSSPSAKHLCKSSHDDCTIQILPHNSQNNTNCKTTYQHVDHHIEHQEIPKKALLATVRASHSRGRCRQGQVRQMLADPHLCPPHPHSTPSRSVPGSLTASDVEEAEDTEDSEHGTCTHDTPSRVPLIYRPSEASRIPTPPSSQSSATSPAVPAALVFLVFTAYVFAGATAFATARGWSFLDAIYFCFVALSTIGVGDILPQTADFGTQMHLFACCLYLFLGLIVVAMCFSLVQEEISNRCRQLASNVGLGRHD